MLTIFSWLKPFDNGPLEMIQRCAVDSWLALDAKPRLVVVGCGDAGIEEFCHKKALEYRQVANGQGTPLVKEVFLAGRTSLDATALYAYVSPELLLNDDFVQTAKILENGVGGPFLASGRSRKLEINQRLKGKKDFQEAQRILSGQSADSSEKMDYFLFSKGAVGDIPPFVMEQEDWKEWLVWGCIAAKIPVVDISEKVLAITLCCPESMPRGQSSDVPAAGDDLTGGHNHLCNLQDADYIFHDGELQKNRSVEYYERRFIRPLLALREKFFQPIKFKPQADK